MVIKESVRFTLFDDCAMAGCIPIYEKENKYCNYFFYIVICTRRAMSDEMVLQDVKNVTNIVGLVVGFK